jgi:predicted DNA-binding transcriptional regulator YafY
MRGIQITRQWGIIKLLEDRKQGLSVAEIASHLDANQRTVYRDIDDLAIAGFPLYSEQVDGVNRWKLIEGSKSKLPLPVTMTELMALHMSRDILKVFKGTVFEESIESFFDKVTVTLPPETIRYLDNISGRLGVRFGARKDFSAFRETITQLSEATGKRLQVEITYKALSTGDQTKRRVDPYQVWAMDGCFYLIGHCHLREKVRTFSMDRIKDLEILKEKFPMPKDFSLDEYLKSAFRVMTGSPETVRVWFEPGVAQIVKERIWHPTQEFREEADGSLIVTLEVPVNYEIISWIMGFGASAEVLSPASLKKTIMEEHRTAAARYLSESRSGKKDGLPEKTAAPLS